MNRFYRAGVAMVGDGDIFTSPSSMRSKIEEVNASFTNFNRDVQRLRGGAELRTQWDGYFSTWRSFYEETTQTFTSDVPLISPLWWGSTLTRAQDFERNLNAWKNRFRQAGLIQTSPNISPTPRPGDVVGSITGLIKWGSILALVLAGGYVATQLMSAKKSADKLLSSE